MFAIFLILINLSLWWRIFFLLVGVYLNRPGHWDGAHIWFVTIVDTLNQTFLILAGIVNIYNWISFSLWLRVYDEESIKRNRFWMRILNVTTPIICTLIILTYLSFFTMACAMPLASMKNDDAIYGVNIILFALLGICFIFATLFLKHRLRLWNEEIEKYSRCKVSFASHILSIPFLL